MLEFRPKWSEIVTGKCLQEEQPLAEETDGKNPGARISLVYFRGGETAGKVSEEGRK